MVWNLIGVRQGRHDWQDLIPMIILDKKAILVRVTNPDIASWSKHKTGSLASSSPGVHVGCIYEALPFGRIDQSVDIADG